MSAWALRNPSPIVVFSWLSGLSARLARAPLGRRPSPLARARFWCSGRRLFVKNPSNKNGLVAFFRTAAPLNPDRSSRRVRDGGSTFRNAKFRLGDSALLRSAIGCFVVVVSGDCREYDLQLLNYPPPPQMDCPGCMPKDLCVDVQVSGEVWES